MGNFFADLWGIVPQSIKDAAQIKIGQLTSGTDIRPENLLAPEAQQRAQEKGKYVETTGRPTQASNFFADIAKPTQKVIPQKPAIAPLVTADIGTQKSLSPEFDNKKYITPSSIATDAVQGVARSGAKVGLAVNDIYYKKTEPTSLEIDPTASNLEKNFFSGLFGQDKIEGLATDVADTELSLQPHLRYKRSAETLSPLIVGGLLALDFMPGGKTAKTIGKELLEATTETAAKDILKSTGLVDDVVESFAPKFAKASTKEEVDNLLISLADNVDTLEKQGKVTETIRLGADGEPIKNIVNAEKVQSDGINFFDQAKNYKSSGPSDVIQESKTLISTENPYYKNWESFKPDQPHYAKLKERAIQFAKDKGYDSLEIPGGEIIKAEKALPTAEQMNSIQEGIQSATNKANYERLKTEVSKEAENTLFKKTNLATKFKEMMTPVKVQDPEVQSIYKKWVKQKLAGKVVADSELKRLNVPNEQGLEIIHAYESGQVTPFSHAIETAFKDLKKEAQSRGLEFGELKNYLPHVYDESPEDITKAISKYMQDKGLSAEEVANYIAGKTELTADQARRLKLNPSFVKDRVIPTYAKAMEYGLTPKYTNPAQLIAHYRAEMEKSLANRDFLSNLIDAGKLKVLEALPKNTNWKAVDLPFSQKGYYAEPKLAKMLNGLFRNEDDLPFITLVAQKAANASKFMQEIALSAGIPRTPFNFFTTGQVIKEMTSWNFKAVMPYLRAYFPKRTREFFLENVTVMQKMAQQGIDLGDHIAGFDKMYVNIARKAWWKNIFGGEIKKAKKGVREAFDWAFNESTFASFMPQLYIQTYKDAEKRAIAKGIADPSKFAGDVVKNAFGLLEDMGRSENTKDAISAVFFAPKFREGLVNTLWNTGRSMTTQFFNPTFYKNRRLFAGMAITFGLYNAANKKLNGNYMWENESGKEFDLKVPAGDGQYVYVPFMPSFLAFPRNMASGFYNYFIKGDTDTGIQKFGSLLSMPLKLTTELFSNQDYFGRPIYGMDDSPLKKAEKIGLYIGLNANHPYIKELMRQFITQPEKPIYQSISEALELPLKFNSEDNIARSEFYSRMKELDSERAKARKVLQPRFDEVQKLISEDRMDEARAIVGSLSDEEYEVYKDLKSIQKRKDTQTAKTKFYSQYRKIRDKLAEGQRDEAVRMVKELSDKEYGYYKTLKDAGL